MIIIKNRKLLIPEDERYIGTTADSNSEVLTFRIDRYTQTEMDLSAFTVKADIYRYETEETDRADLEMEVQDNYILLYLYITSGMVAYPGTVLIDIKAFNDDGTVKWSSYKGAFFVEDPFATPQATQENLTELEQLEARINRAIATANEKAIEAAENWLNENVHPETGYVIDKSLRITGAAADAKIVGDAIASEAALRANADSAEATARQNADNELRRSVNAEISARTTQDDALQSQITQLITPGPAPTISEVENARVSATGVTFDTLGNAIRTQVSNIETELLEGNAPNLITFTPGSWTSHGVTFTASADQTVTVNGTADDNVVYNVRVWENSFPSGIAPGDELYLSFAGTNVWCFIYIAEGSTVRNIAETRNSLSFKIPLSATGIGVRLAVAKNTTASAETVRVGLYPGYTNKALKTRNDFLESSVQTIMTNVWHKGLLTAAGVINTSSNGIYSDIISGCNSINVNLDHIAYVLLYRNGYYIGKIAADGSLNRTAGDWKAFRGYQNIGSILDQYNADSARITVTPQSTSTITEANANDYGNVNCEITADVYIRTSNGKSEALEDAKALLYILGNPLYPYYKGFQFCVYDASGENVGYGSPTYERCTAICQFDKPVYISINHSDYTLGIYWKENGTLYNKATSPTWEVPAGVPVAIVIRRGETDPQQSMQGETPWKYLFVRELDDKPRDFFLPEVEDTIKKVQDANTEPSLCFTLSTDHHYMTTVNWLMDYDSISDMTANMKAVGEAINFDFNVSLGDLTDCKAPYSAAVAARFGILDTSAEKLDSIFKHWIDYGMKRFKNVNPNSIYVCGNHDDNRYLRVDTGVSGYDYTPGEMYSYYMSNAYKTLTGSNPDNLLEYYFDIDRLGIRVIVLDSNYYNGTGWDYGFSDSTADWLGGVLASSSGKQVLILSHMSPVASHNGDNYAYHNFDAVANVIQTWKTGGGDLIALMYGHSHCDWSATSPWLDITFCCQKIHQLPSSELFANMPGCVAPARTFGTATEDCWNVVIIKPKSRKINIIRFGAGVDREYTY